LFLPRGRTLPLPLLNLIRFLSAQLSSLSRSHWLAAQPAGVAFLAAGVQKLPGAPGVGGLSAVGEGSRGAWRHGGEWGPGTLAPRPCVQGLCLWALCFIWWKWRLSGWRQQRAQCLLRFSAGVSHLVWRVSRWWGRRRRKETGWKEFLPGNGGLALAGSLCSQMKTKRVTLYLGQPQSSSPASEGKAEHCQHLLLLCTAVVFSSQKGKTTTAVLILTVRICFARAQRQMIVLRPELFFTTVIMKKSPKPERAELKACCGSSPPRPGGWAAAVAESPAVGGSRAARAAAAAQLLHPSSRRGSARRLWASLASTARGGRWDGWSEGGSITLPIALPFQG